MLELPVLQLYKAGPFNSCSESHFPRCTHRKSKFLVGKDFTLCCFLNPELSSNPLPFQRKIVLNQNYTALVVDTVAWHSPLPLGMKDLLPLIISMGLP